MTLVVRGCGVLSAVVLSAVGVTKGSIDSRRLALLAALALAAGSWGCAPDPQKAASRAEEFARLAFQDGDTEAAYALFSEEARKQVSLQQLEATVARMHPQGRPSAVHPVEYELLESRGAVNIYLVGEGNGELFHYRVTLDRSRLRGYRVAGLFRYLQGFPDSTARRPLAGSQG